jgi:hypothetical protein
MALMAWRIMEESQLHTIMPNAIMPNAPMPISAH